MTKTAIAVTQDPERVVETPVLAESIVRIGDALANLQRGGLNQKAIVTLVHDYTGVPKKQIIAVIEGIQSLKQVYTVSK